MKKIENETVVMFVPEVHERFIPKDCKTEEVLLIQNEPLDHAKWLDGHVCPESVVLAKKGNVYGTYLESEVPSDYEIIPKCFGFASTPACLDLALRVTEDK